MSDLRGKLFTALTGRDADVSGQTGGDLRGMLMAVGGASRRTSTFFTFKARFSCASSHTPPPTTPKPSNPMFIPSPPSSR